MEVIRNYVKRESEKSDWHGEVGSATFEITGKDLKFTLDGKELGEDSARHLMNFALQTLQDAYAGAKSLDEAKGSFAKKRDAIIAGTLGVRGSGEGVSERKHVERRITIANIKVALKSDAAKLASFEALDDDAKNAKADEVYAKNAAKLSPKVDAELARLAEMRAAKKAAIEADLEM